MDGWKGLRIDECTETYLTRRSDDRSIDRVSVTSARPRETMGRQTSEEHTEFVVLEDEHQIGQHAHTCVRSSITAIRKRLSNGGADVT